MSALAFGAILKALRLKKELTISKLAELSGVSQPYLSQIENGKGGIPSPDILSKLSKPLGVTTIELMENAGHIKRKEMEENSAIMLDVLKEVQEMEFVFEKLDNNEKEQYFDEQRDGIIDKLKLMRKYLAQPEYVDLTIPLDLSLLIETPGLTYKNREITDQHRQLIIAYLDALVPDRNK